MAKKLFQQKSFFVIPFALCFIGFLVWPDYGTHYETDCSGAIDVAHGEECPVAESPDQNDQVFGGGYRFIHTKTYYWFVNDGSNPPYDHRTFVVSEALTAVLVIGAGWFVALAVLHRNTNSDIKK